MVAYALGARDKEQAEFGSRLLAHTRSDTMAMSRCRGPPVPDFGAMGKADIGIGVSADTIAKQVVASMNIGPSRGGVQRLPSLTARLQI